ncbi:MAG TPA: hypothetical protein P5256_04845, partial [Beijerinckiaceae bacterium]|nr:hypothetical protein [Beijerinckiaceae bacterium]
MTMRPRLDVRLASQMRRNIACLSGENMPRRAGGGLAFGLSAIDRGAFDFSGMWSGIDLSAYVNPGPVTEASGMSRAEIPLTVGE